LCMGGAGEGAGGNARVRAYFQAYVTRLFPAEVAKAFCRACVAALRPIMTILRARRWRLRVAWRTGGSLTRGYWGVKRRLQAVVIRWAAAVLVACSMLITRSYRCESRTSRW